MGSETNNVEKTIEKLIDIKRLINNYTSMLEEEHALESTTITEFVILRDFRIDISTKIPMQVDCNDELAKRLEIPCGKSTLEKIVLFKKIPAIYGNVTMIVEILGYRLFSPEINLSPLKLRDLLYLYFLNEHAGILNIVEEAVKKHVEKEAKWVETLKELMTLIEMVFKQQ